MEDAVSPTQALQLQDVEQALEFLRGMLALSAAARTALDEADPAAALQAVNGRARLIEAAGDTLHRYAALRAGLAGGHRATPATRALEARCAEAERLAAELQQADARLRERMEATYAQLARELDELEHAGAATAAYRAHESRASLDLRG